MFNKAGFRHGHNREVYNTGYVYDGLWEDGMIDVPEELLGLELVMD